GESARRRGASSAAWARRCARISGVARPKPRPARRVPARRAPVSPTIPPGLPGINKNARPARPPFGAGGPFRLVAPPFLGASWRFPGHGGGGMDRIRIYGAQRLNGTIPISGAKNATLPLMIASLLTDKTLVLDNVPRLADVSLLQRILGNHGVDIMVSGKRSGETQYD